MLNFLHFPGYLHAYRVGKGEIQVRKLYRNFIIELASFERSSSVYIFNIFSAISLSIGLSFDIVLYTYVGYIL